MSKLVQKSKLCMKTHTRTNIHTLHVVVSFDVYNAHLLTHPKRKTEYEEKATREEKKNNERTPILLIGGCLLRQSHIHTANLKLCQNLHTSHTKIIQCCVRHILSLSTRTSAFSHVRIHSYTLTHNERTRKKEKKVFRCTYTYAKNGYH